MTPQEKKRARAVAYSALRRGELTRQPCQECGTTERVEAHHPKGYEPAHVLTVEWLCKTHHAMTHKRFISADEVLAAIRQAGSPEKAAPLLGVSRKTVYRRMAEYGIKAIYA